MELFSQCEPRAAGRERKDILWANFVDSDDFTTMVIDFHGGPMHGLARPDCGDHFLEPAAEEMQPYPQREALSIGGQGDSFSDEEESVILAFLCGALQGVGGVADQAHGLGAAQPPAAEDQSGSGEDLDAGGNQQAASAEVQEAQGQGWNSPARAAKDFDPESDAKSMAPIPEYPSPDFDETEPAEPPDICESFLWSNLLKKNMGRLKDLGRLLQVHSANLPGPHHLNYEELPWEAFFSIRAHPLKSHFREQMSPAVFQAFAWSLRLKKAKWTDIGEDG